MKTKTELYPNGAEARVQFLKMFTKKTVLRVASETFDDFGHC